MVILALTIWCLFISLPIRTRQVEFFDGWRKQPNTWDNVKLVNFLSTITTLLPLPYAPLGGKSIEYLLIIITYHFTFRVKLFTFAHNWGSIYHLWILFLLLIDEYFLKTVRVIKTKCYHQKNLQVLKASKLQIIRYFYHVIRSPSVDRKTTLLRSRECYSFYETFHLIEILSMWSWFNSSIEFLNKIMMRRKFTRYIMSSAYCTRDRSSRFNLFLGRKNGKWNDWI